MSIHPIRTADDNQAALKTVSPMFDAEPEPGSEEGDLFEVMLTLTESYEAKHFPVDLPNPIDAIKFRMEQSVLTAADLAPAIGKTNQVYEVPNGKRSYVAYDLEAAKHVRYSYGKPYKAILSGLMGSG